MNYEQDRQLIEIPSLESLVPINMVRRPIAHWDEGYGEPQIDPLAIKDSIAVLPGYLYIPAEVYTRDPEHYIKSVSAALEAKALDAVEANTSFLIKKPNREFIQWMMDPENPYNPVAHEGAHLMKALEFGCENLGIKMNYGIDFDIGFVGIGGSIEPNDQLYDREGNRLTGDDDRAAYIEILIAPFALSSSGDVFEKGDREIANAWVDYIEDPGLKAHYMNRIRSKPDHPKFSDWMVDNDFKARALMRGMQKAWKKMRGGF